MLYLTMSVPFSIEYLQASYIYVSPYEVVLAQLFQTFLLLVKNNIFFYFFLIRERIFQRIWLE